MAGITGPIPERSDQRVRRNIGDPIDKITEIGPVPIPALGIVDPHPLVKSMYESLKRSAQRKYFEPSDWEYAKLTMYLVNEMLWNTGGKPISAMKISAVNQMLSSLLMTEGDRRRVRIEVERQNTAGDGAQVLQVADLFRQRLNEAKNQG